ncbi:hypothetical protein HDU87_007159 [Geranomyces variabilis]|uniref:Uncharacterized protein n=1 Tax=Geranomyces variabilis TaxID=109894 RepID=A0AAD5TEB6_9FUNG|nr:hypothetical protein HDU87_007159 [Geranomyces variabilis]
MPKSKAVIRATDAIYPEVRDRFGVRMPKERRKRFQNIATNHTSDHDNLRTKVGGNRISPNTWRLQAATLALWSDWAETRLPAVDEGMRREPLLTPRMPLPNRIDVGEQSHKEDDRTDAGIFVNRVNEVLAVVNGDADSTKRRYTQCFQTIKSHIKRMEIFFRNNIPAWQDMSSKDQLAYWTEIDTFVADLRATFPDWSSRRKSHDPIGHYEVKLLLDAIDAMILEGKLIALREKVALLCMHSHGIRISSAAAQVTYARWQWSDTHRDKGSPPAEGLRVGSVKMEILTKNGVAFIGGFIQYTFLKDAYNKPGSRTILIDAKYKDYPVLCHLDDSKVPATTDMIGRTLKKAAIKAGLPAFRIDNHGFRRGFATQAEDVFGRQRAQRLLVHGDGSHITETSYLGNDLSRYDPGAMWTGEGPAVKPVSHLASARLNIPVFPSLTTEGLDSVLEKDKLYQELVNQLMSAKTNDAVESFRKHIKNRRRQIKASIEREIHKQIFQDLPSAVKEWSSVTTPGALAAITAAPRTADLPGLDASAAELGSSEPDDDSIQGAVADPLASLFGYLEPLVRGMQELKRARTPDSDNNENATFRCVRCSFVGVAKKALDRHFRTHHNNGLQVCRWDGCQHATRINNIRAHEDTCPKNLSRKTWNCPTCPKTYLSSSGLKRHKCKLVA